MSVHVVEPDSKMGRERMVDVQLKLRVTPSLLRRFQADADRRHLALERWLVEVADAHLAGQDVLQGIRPKISP